MREFIVVGHRAVTEPFKLNNLPGAGRMDILCRCVNSAFFLSHDIRRDTRLYLLLLGPPQPPLCIRFEGSELKYLNPDERSAASLINKALEKPHALTETPSTPGVWIQQKNFEKLLSEKQHILYLREDGEDIRAARIPEDAIFVLGDHEGLKREEEVLLEKHGAWKLSVGPLSLHADHCIVIVHNELDRRHG
jgi:tRNA (pseudouridine54-N1)-methyltransferase